MYIMIRWNIASTFFQFAINLQSICKKVTYIFLKSNPQHTRKGSRSLFFKDLFTSIFPFWQ